jgi:hypothetical protein
MHCLRTTAAAAGVLAGLSLPAHAAPAADAVTSVVAPAERGDRWGPETMLPDGSTARFGKNIDEPRIRITFGSGRTVTLSEDKRRAAHEDWKYALTKGPHLKVADPSSDLTWVFDFDGRPHDTIEA